MRRTPVRMAIRAVVPATVLTVLVTMLTACGQGSPGGTPTPAGSAAAGSSGSSGSSGSDSDGASAPGPSATGTSGDVTLVASAQADASGSMLLIDYTLSQSGDADLVALDRVPADLGSATLPADLDPEHAWVHAEDGVARVSKQGFDTAPGVRFMAAPVIGGRALGSGSTLTGRATVPLPPVLDVPSDSFDAPRDPISADLQQWQLCIQVVERSAPMRPSPDDPSVLLVPVAAPESGQLVCTPPQALPGR